MPQAAPSTSSVRFGSFEVNFQAGELRRRGTRIKLQEQPFQVLAILLERAGDLVPRDEFRQRIWGDDTFVDFDHSLSIAINKLREALGDSSEFPRYIETVPRRGYRFVYPITPRETEPPAPVAQTRSPLWFRAAAIAFAFVLVATAAWLIYRARAGTEAPIRTIAVLPLDNLSGDAAQDYFADGITDELITELARMGGVRVISRTSSMKYKHAAQNLPQIARELNVDGVVEGAVARSGNRVRVTVQLIRADSDQHLWANSYERDVTDILALQAEIAAAVARELRVELALHIPPPGMRKPVNREAYAEYLKGRYAWNLRRESALLEAIDHFEQAVKIDPTFAAAYSGLADSHTSLGYLNSRAPEDTFPRARLAAEKALDLDASLAEPHASLAYYYLYYERNWDAADREFRKAIELNPNYALAHDWYGVYLTARARWNDALKEVELARQLDPLSLAISTDVGFALYYSGKYDQAIASLQSTLERDPGFPLAHLWLGRAYEEKGMYADALAEFQQTQKALPGWPVATAAMGWVYGVWGKPAEARRVLEELKSLSKRRYVTSYAIGLVYAGLGENDQAFRALDQAVREKTNWVVWTAIDPRWKPIRNDPRFPTLLRQIGLEK